MTQATYPLPASVADLDLTNPPGIAFTAAGRRYLVLDDGTDEPFIYQFTVPANYASAPLVNIFYSMPLNTNDIAVGVEVMATTDGEDVETDSFDTINYTTEAVPGTAGLMSKVVVTLTNNDSMAAGDYVALRIRRDADQTSGAGNDDSVGDMKYWGAEFEYTTT